MSFSPGTTQINYLPPYEEFPTENGDLLKDILTRRTRRTADAINDRTIGLYMPVELQDGSRWFPSAGNDPNIDRYEFRFVMTNFGALPNAASKQVAHGIPNASQITWFVNARGVAKNPVTPVWLPFPNGNVVMTVDQTNVTITTSVDYSAYTQTYIILEYLKQA